MKKTKSEINKLKLHERVEMEKEMFKNSKKRKEERQKIEKQRELNNKRFFLGELIKKDNPNFGANNLILAPTGSGKSHFIQEQLIPKYVKAGDLIYYLVSTTSLKRSVCPEDSVERRALAYPSLDDEGNEVSPQSLGFFTTGNKESFGDVDYRVHVMTYSEFGGLVTVVHDEAEKAPLIVCDEIHSAPNYRSINNDPSLTLAIHYLFGKHEGQSIYYFTATSQKLKDLEEITPTQLRFVETFDYRHHPNIRRYVWHERHLYNHIEQIRSYIRPWKEAVDYRGYKTLAFTAQIRQMETMEKIFIDEGFTPLLLWSVNNPREMTSNQIKALDTLMLSGLIPEPYDVLIINGGLQEGWNLNDDMVRFAVINSTDETEVIQSIGRIRGDVTTLVQRTNELVVHQSIVFPEEFMEVSLTTDMKSDLCEYLDIKDNKGRQLKWTSIKKIAQEKGYEVLEGQKTIKGKRQRVSTIRRKVLTREDLSSLK